jgi:hypothetical protein
MTRNATQHSPSDYLSYIYTYGKLPGRIPRQMLEPIFKAIELRHFTSLTNHFSWRLCISPESYASDSSSIHHFVATLRNLEFRHWLICCPRTDIDTPELGRVLLKRPRDQRQQWLFMDGTSQSCGGVDSYYWWERPCSEVYTDETGRRAIFIRVNFIADSCDAPPTEGDAVIAFSESLLSPQTCLTDHAGPRSVAGRAPMDLPLCGPGAFLRFQKQLFILKQAARGSLDLGDRLS